MNDNYREMLEMAAKAIGADPKRIFAISGYIDGAGDDQYRHWNPLEDDGDAFRLMLAMQIDISFWREEDSVCVSVHGDLAATAVGAIGDIELRIAIVRCAAEIGRRMP